MTVPEFVVQNLACARGGVPVLSGVDLTVPAGETLLIKGPNGAGKTTLLRTLAGLQPALAGSIAPGPEVVAYAGHADGLKGALSVSENLMFWAGVFGFDDIEPAIEAFDLGRLRDRPAQHLSAGQRRRLALARMVLTGRAVWIFDEPTVSLDTDGVTLFAAAVRAHLGSGGVAIVATHVDIGLTGPTLDIGAFGASAEVTFGEGIG